MIERANASIKEVIQKSLEIDENYDWVMNLQNLVDNIKNPQHRITGFIPNKIQEAVLKNDEELLNKAQENELKKKKRNISKEIFYIKDLVRIIQPSDKTQQVWSSEIYEIEKVYKPLKVYSVYEYTLKGLKDKFEEEELLKIDGIRQKKFVKIEKFEISKLIKPLIKDNVAYYEVMCKRFNEPTLEPREVLLKDVPKMINQFEKKNKINFYKNKKKRTGEITPRFHII
jgi:hypothetical protein